MTDKPTLRDRRRTEAREALYRAITRRDRLIDGIVRNTEQIRKLKRTLKRLETPPTLTHELAVSVAEGKVLDKIEQIETELARDEIPDWGIR